MIKWKHGVFPTLRFYGDKGTNIDISTRTIYISRSAFRDSRHHTLNLSCLIIKDGNIYTDKKRFYSSGDIQLSHIEDNYLLARYLERVCTMMSIYFDDDGVEQFETDYYCKTIEEPLTAVNWNDMIQLMLELMEDIK